MSVQRFEVGKHYRFEDRIPRSRVRKCVTVNDDGAPWFEGNVEWGRTEILLKEMIEVNPDGSPIKRGFKVGDKVRVVRSDRDWNEFREHELGMVTAISHPSTSVASAWVVEGSTKWWSEDMLEHVDEPAEDREVEPTLKPVLDDRLKVSPDAPAHELLHGRPQEIVTTEPSVDPMEEVKTWAHEHGWDACAGKTDPFYVRDEVLVERLGKIRWGIHHHTLGPLAHQCNGPQAAMEKADELFPRAS